jgi:hypothetical protein
MRKLFFLLLLNRFICCLPSPINKTFFQEIIFKYNFDFQEDDVIIENFTNGLKMMVCKKSKNILCKLDKNNLLCKEEIIVDPRVFPQSTLQRSSVLKYSLINNVEILVYPRRREIVFKIPFILSSVEYEPSIKHLNGYSLKFIEKDE